MKPLGQKPAAGHVHSADKCGVCASASTRENKAAARRERFSDDAGMMAQMGDDLKRLRADRDTLIEAMKRIAEDDRLSPWAVRQLAREALEKVGE